MQYAMIAAALVGAVAASPAWAPPAYGGSGDSWGSASTVDSTTVVTITSCGPEVTNCPASSYTAPPAYTSSAVTTSEEVPPPAYTWPASSESTTSYSPETTSAGWGPPAYAPSSPAAPPASSPYSPVSSSVESIPPPAYATPSSPAAPPASSPYSPIGTSAPPAWGSPVPSYPVPGNGSYPAPSGTVSGAPSASNGYPVEQTGNTAAGIKAGSLVAVGAFAALFL